MTQRTLLIGIGAQKAGTSWLGDYFNTHKNIYMSPIKELHYFDRRQNAGTVNRYANRVARRIRMLDSAGGKWDETLTAADQLVDAADRFAMIFDERRYVRFFTDRASEQHRVMCEITPSYATLSANDFGRIKACHPKVKLLFILRNPADRVWSHVRYGSRGTLTVEVDPNEVIQRQGVLLRTDYERTLRRILTVFARNDVHVEFYEHLFNDNTIRGICEFLDISFQPGNYSEFVNATGNKAQLPEQHRILFARAFRHVYKYVGELFPGRLPDQWIADMALLN